MLLACAVAVGQSLQSGRRLAEEGRWREAEEAFRRSLKENPDSIEAVTFHARALTAIGQPFDATLELEEFLRREPDSVPVLKLYGHLLDAFVQDKEKAEEVLQRCARLAPRDPDVWRSLGNLYLVRNRFEDSIKSFQAAVRLNPSSPLFVASLAYVEGKLSPSPKIDAAFARAARGNKHSRRPDPSVPLLYGDYLLQRGRTEAGAAQLTAALLLDPHLAEGYFLRGLAHERLMKYPLAEADALAAIREDSNRRDARQLLLRVYRALGDEAKAAAQAEILQKLSDEGGKQEATGRDIRRLLASAEPLLREGKFAEAARAYEEIVRASPDFYEGWFALGMSYFQLGRNSEAENALKKYLRFQPISADGHSALGVLYLQQGRYEEAKSAFKQAVEIDPEAGEARKGLAASALGTADARAAAAAVEPLYEKGSDCDPECYVLLAKSNFALGRVERVAEVLNRGLEQHKQSIEYLKSLTRLLLEERPRNPLTRRFVEILKQRLPNEAESYYYSSMLEFSNSRWAQAIAEANAGFEKNANEFDRSRLYTVVGRARENLGDSEGAEAAYKTALAESPAADAGIYYAQFLTRRLRSDEAFDLLARIIESPHHAAAAYLERAKLFFANKDTEKAIADGNLALQRAGTDLDTIRGAHTLLIRAYYAAGKKNEALSHQRKLQAMK
jgi:tetratricopeptide (TPR) repeat protein